MSISNANSFLFHRVPVSFHDHRFSFLALRFRFRHVFIAIMCMRAVPLFASATVVVFASTTRARTAHVYGSFHGVAMLRAAQVVLSVPKLLLHLPRVLFPSHTSSHSFLALVSISTLHVALRTVSVLDLEPQQVSGFLGNTPRRGLR